MLKYTIKMTIDAPRDEVVKFFTDRTRITEWQSGLKQSTLIAGEDGQVGAKYRLSLGILGGMTETIAATEPPDKHIVIYESGGITGKVWNEHGNFFQATDPQKTEWTIENTFKCSGLSRLIVFIMPWLFRATTRTYMRGFKKFAEAGSPAPENDTATAQTEQTPV